MIIFYFLVLKISSLNALSFISTELTNQNTNSIFIKSLFQEHLKNQKVSIILDDEINIDLDDVLQVAHEHCSSVFISNTGDFDNLIQKSPLHFIRGQFFTTIFIFFNDPEQFLTRLLSNWEWNPDYLILISLNTALDTKLIVGHEAVQRSRYILLCEQGRQGSEIFNLYTSKPQTKIRNTNLKKERIGKWNGKYDITGPLFHERFDNFNNKTLQVTSFCDDFPFIYHKNDNCIGLNLDIFNIIANHLNFSYDFQSEPEDGIFGFFENGTGFGQFGEIMYNNKDIALNAPVVNNMQGFDFLYPSYLEHIAVVLRLPPPTPQWLTIFYPFNLFLWITLITVTIGIMILLTAILTFAKDTQNPDTVFMIVSNNFIQLIIAIIWIFRFLYWNV